MFSQSVLLSTEAHFTNIFSAAFSAEAHFTDVFTECFLVYYGTFCGCFHRMQSCVLRHNSLMLLQSALLSAEACFTVHFSEWTLVY